MSKINNVRLPNAATQNYSPEQFNQLVRSLEQIVLQLNSTYASTSDTNQANAFSFMEGIGRNAISSLADMMLPYGSFYDTTIQSAAVINTAYPIAYNTTVFSNGVYVDPTNPSRIYVDHPGVYNFQFSIQLDKPNASSDHVHIWPRINGVDVPNSASKVSLTGSDAELIPAWNFFVDMNSGDYFQLMWTASDIRLVITSFPAVPPVPAVPSVIMTVSFVSSSYGAV